MSITLNASTSSGFVQSADNSGEIELQSNGTTALKVNTNEGIQILNCLGVGNATPSTSGAGITFPATQSASSDANTLDDYEEGSFTPIVYGLSTTGTTTYSDQVGFYTKVGNVVTAFYQVTVSAMTGTGAVALGGLPFTTNSSGASAAPVMVEALNWTGGSYIQLYIGSSRTYAVPYYMTDDSNWASQQCVNETQAYIATITYRV